MNSVLRLWCLISIASLLLTIAAPRKHFAEEPAKQAGIRPPEFDVEVTQLEGNLRQIRSALGDDKYFDQFPTGLEKSRERVRLFSGFVLGSAWLRSPEQLPALIELLGVSHPSHDSFRLGYTYSAKYSNAPAWYALREIGLPAVPKLLNVLKEDPARDGPHNVSNAERQQIALKILWDIYEVGGHGKAMLTERLKLEIAQSTGIEKERLNAALTQLSQLDYDPAKEREQWLKDNEERRNIIERQQRGRREQDSEKDKKSQVPPEAQKP